MKDRVPTKPNRYAVYDDAHVFLRYEYHERADDPTQAGDPLSKNTLLKDGTATLLGLQPATAVPDDAFVALYLGNGNYGYMITITYENGSPAKNLNISGITNLAGAQLVTDNNGYALGVSKSASPSIAIDFSNYIDVNSVSRSLSATGKVTNVGMTITRNATKSATITTSKTIKFSPMTTKFDVALIGGGGGGREYGGGGGGGGRVSNFLKVTNTGASMNLSIGAGGARDSGGATTLSGVGSAEGGNSGGSGGQGNGNGADSGSNGNGGDATTFPFNDPSIPCSGGGGDGTLNFPTTGGKGYGGNGGAGNGGGSNGTGYGGGGGGGGSWGDYGGLGGNGYQGAAMLRWV